MLRSTEELTFVPLTVDTRPPVDLYCYYLFLQREGSEDTLDFWLDVQQHENLCAFLLPHPLHRLTRASQVAPSSRTFASPAEASKRTGRDTTSTLVRAEASTAA